MGVHSRPLPQGRKYITGPKQPVMRGQYLVTVVTACRQPLNHNPERCHLSEKRRMCTRVSNPIREIPGSGHQAFYD